MPPSTVTACRRTLHHGVAIFLVSFGVLTVEIALTRIFSYAISYHFAYLTIATALLGFGGAGSLLAAFPGLLGGAERRVALAATLGGLAAVTTLAFCSVVRFDANQIGHDPAGMLVLLLYSAVVTVPFLLAGLVVATVLALHLERVGFFYACDLLGAALGCAASVWLMWTIETPATVVVGALAMAVAGVVVAGGSGRSRLPAILGLVLTLLAGTLTIVQGPFPPSRDKFLSLFLADPRAVHLYQQWTPISRVDVVGWKSGATDWGASYAAAGVGRGVQGTVVLFSLLACTGIGSALATRIRTPTRALPTMVGLLAALVVAFLAFAPAVFASCLQRALPLRILASVLMIAPLGLVLGVFFPLGVRTLAADSVLISWALAINGCTTVVGTVLAVVLAMSLGFTAVMTLALAAYGIGATALWLTSGRSSAPLDFIDSGGAGP